MKRKVSVFAECYWAQRGVFFVLLFVLCVRTAIVWAASSAGGLLNFLCDALELSIAACVLESTEGQTLQIVEEFGI